MNLLFIGDVVGESGCEFLLIPLVNKGGDAHEHNRSINFIAGNIFGSVLY